MRFAQARAPSYTWLLPFCSAGSVTSPRFPVYDDLSVEVTTTARVVPWGFVRREKPEGLRLADLAEKED